MTKRRVFSKTFKKKVVEAFLKGRSRSLAQLRRRHKLSSAMIASWKKQYEKNKEEKREHIKTPSYYLPARQRDLLIHAMNRFRIYQTRFKELNAPYDAASCGHDAGLIEGFLDSREVLKGELS